MIFKDLQTPIYFIHEADAEISLLPYFEAIRNQGLRLVPTALIPTTSAISETESPFLIVFDLNQRFQEAISMISSLQKEKVKIPILVLVSKAEHKELILSQEFPEIQVADKTTDIESFLGMIKTYAHRRMREMKEEADEQRKILEIFAEEAKETVADLDQLILRLESKPIDFSIVNTLFKKIHTIKGSSGCVPAAYLVTKLSHHFETSLTELKNGRIVVTPLVVDVYLAVADFIHGQIQRLNGGMPRESDELEVEKLCERLITLEKNLTSQLGENNGVVVPLVNAAEDGFDSDNISVTNEKLDNLMKLCGELVVLKNAFYMLTSGNEWKNQLALHEKRMWDFNRSLNLFSDQLQEQMMSIRKVSLSKSVSKIQRLFRQTSKELGKNAKLNLDGFDIKVDKNISKVFSTCMTHLVRNALDHGLEKEETRLKFNKEPAGNLSIRVRENTGVVYFEFEDDGAGIDKEIIRKKAIEKNIVSFAAASSLSDKEIFELIFLPGFSTAEKLSSVSGRGVGMDAVRSAILSLNGKIDISSRLGEGTCFTIEIPIPKTVVVEQTIIAQSNKILFAIPLVGISHITAISKVEMTHIGSYKTMQFLGSTIQCIHFHELLSFEEKNHGERFSPKGSIILLRGKNNTVGLLVDEIIGQLDAVVRPFASIAGNVGVALKGTTVLDEEKVAYVISPQDAVEHILQGQHQEGDSQ